MKLDEAKKILEDNGFMVENSTNKLSPEELEQERAYLSSLVGFRNSFDNYIDELVKMKKVFSQDNINYEEFKNFKRKRKMMLDSYLETFGTIIGMYDSYGK